MNKIIDKNKNKLVKLFKGSTNSIVEQKQDYRHVNYYSQCLELKADYPYSYVYQYKRHYKAIAQSWNCCRKTAINRVERLIETGYASVEGSTLRFLSNTEIRKQYASKSTHKQHNYEYVKATDIANEVKSQALEDNIKIQQKAFNKNSNRSAAKNDKPSSQLTFRELLKRNPNIKSDNVDTTLLSQQKVAKLLGYRSKTSGKRALKRLSEAKFLEIESNVIPLRREEFNFYKTIAPSKVLIKGRGNQARFFFCNANTVKIIKRDTVKPATVNKENQGIAYYNSIYF